MSDTKASNPKQAFADGRVPMHLIPGTALIEEALAFLEGALKYGGYNYRVVGVKTSTYLDAMKRHIEKFENGQDRDPKTFVHELGSVRACCAIIIDGMEQNNINDDRPPCADIAGMLTRAETVVAHLRELFKDHSPPQYTEREHGDSIQQRTVALMLCPEVHCGLNADHIGPCGS